MRFLYLLTGITMAFTCNTYSRAMTSDASHGCVSCHVEGRVPSTVGGSLKDLENIGHFTDEQFEKISRYICKKFDQYKSNTKAVPKKYVSSCKSPTEFVCSGETDYLSMRGIVRVGIHRTLGIKSAQEFENSIPHVISNLMKFSCKDVSRHYDLEIPFLKQRRNIAKRAIFLGNTRSFFDEFIFEDYSSVENGKRKTVIDINAIEYVDGEPETLLDYLDKILEPNHASRLGGSNRGDITALRNTLIFSYGAKTAEELGVK